MRMKPTAPKRRMPSAHFTDLGRFIGDSIVPGFVLKSLPGGV
jgi:hypothetical protein